MGVFPGVKHLQQNSPVWMETNILSGPHQVTASSLPEQYFIHNGFDFQLFMLFFFAIAFLLLKTRGYAIFDAVHKHL